MTIQERTKQLRYRKALFALAVINLICWAPFFCKYFGNAINLPSIGTNKVLIDKALNYSVEVNELQEVAVKQECELEAIDLSCEKTITVSQFRKRGRVKYGKYEYTWYSEKVLPGGGLNIPGRKTEVIDGQLSVVTDRDGYIVVASDDLSKQSIVNTPLGRKGKVYDCGPGHGIIDIYVSW